jgi:hypothetical protein
MSTKTFNKDPSRDLTITKVIQDLLQPPGPYYSQQSFPLERVDEPPQTHSPLYITEGEFCYLGPFIVLFVTNTATMRVDFRRIARHSQIIFLYPLRQQPFSLVEAEIKPLCPRLIRLPSVKTLIAVLHSSATPSADSVSSGSSF